MQKTIFCFHLIISNFLSLSLRSPGNMYSRCSFRVSTLWDVPSAAACIFSMRGRPTAGYAWFWQRLSAGSWLDRPCSCSDMSWHYFSSTAHNATAAFALASSHRATACYLCCAGLWSSHSLWLGWPPYQSSINTSSPPQRPSGSGHRWLSATHCWLYTCRVRSLFWTLKLEIWIQV